MNNRDLAKSLTFNELCISPCGGPFCTNCKYYILERLKLNLVSCHLFPKELSKLKSSWCGKGVVGGQIAHAIFEKKLKEWNDIDVKTKLRQQREKEDALRITREKRKRDEAIHEKAIKAKHGLSISGTGDEGQLSLINE